MKPIIKPVQDEDTVKYRLTLLIQTVLDESRFDPTIKRIVSKMIINFLEKAIESELKEKIENLRDEVIPFILTGEEKEHAEPTENSYTDG